MRLHLSIIPALLTFVNPLPQVLVSADYDDSKMSPHTSDPADLNVPDSFSDQTASFDIDDSQESSFMKSQKPAPVDSKYKLPICCEPSVPEHPVCSYCEFLSLRKF